VLAALMKEITRNSSRQANNYSRALSVCPESS
jgi:hypothetical protein